MTDVSAQQAERVPYEDEDEFEPMHGLPEIPPEGERVLWQGEPQVKPVAHRVFHTRMIMAYFAVLLIWSIVDDVAAGLGWAEALRQASVLLIPLGTVMALLWGAAWAIARTTVYTITSRRVVIRAGVAFSKAVNVPFALISSAGVRTCKDGTMDIVVGISGDDRPDYLMLWPHARPGRWRRVEPMLRGIDSASDGARILSEALSKFHDQAAPAEMAGQDQSAGMPAGAAPA